MNIRKEIEARLLGDGMEYLDKLIKVYEDRLAEYKECLHLYLNEYPAFRAKNVGSPNSEVRIEHDRRILIEDRAINALTGGNANAI